MPETFPQMMAYFQGCILRRANAPEPVEAAKEAARNAAEYFIQLEEIEYKVRDKQREANR